MKRLFPVLFLMMLASVATYLMRAAEPQVSLSPVSHSVQLVPVNSDGTFTLQNGWGEASEIKAAMMAHGPVSVECGECHIYSIHYIVEKYCPYQDRERRQAWAEGYIAATKKEINK